MGLIVGVWCLGSSAEFLLQRRKLWDLRQSAITLLGLTFLADAGLSAYAFAHDIRYSPYHDAFHLTRRILIATAILIVVTVVLPAKKQQDTAQKIIGGQPNHTPPPGLPTPGTQATRIRVARIIPLTNP